MLTVDRAAGLAPRRRESVLLVGPSTFLALAVVGFIKLIPVFCPARRVAGSVLEPRVAGGLRAGAGIDPVVVTPVLSEPLRDIPLLFVTELLEALELDLLRFSFELVALVNVGLVLGVFLTVFFRFVVGRVLLTDEVVFGFDVVLIAEDAGVLPSLGESLPIETLLIDLVDEFILTRLPPLRLLIGLRSDVENNV